MEPTDKKPAAAGADDELRRALDRVQQQILDVTAKGAEMMAAREAEYRERAAAYEAFIAHMLERRASTADAARWDEIDHVIGRLDQLLAVSLAALRPTTGAPS